MKITTIAQLEAAKKTLPSFTLSVYEACLKEVETIEVELGEVNQAVFYLDNIYSSIISKKEATGAFSKLATVGLYQPLDECFGLIVEVA